MTKTVVFSVFSLAAAAAVILWVAGVFDASSSSRANGDRGTHPSTAARGKAEPEPTPPAASEAGISVYFSPNGGCTEVICREIAAARQTVFVQAAQFTSAPIAKALVAAKQRGVDVRVVCDRKKDDDDHSQTDRLVEGGVPTFADGRHHTAHNKLVIIDHHLVFTGSFNFTRESESENAENLVLIDGKPKLVAAYEANFKEHLSHSVSYEK
jgi:phosphatidylserine/phosphatidylglycerophosphate/cardiolipin synthase-like enzyme